MILHRYIDLMNHACRLIHEASVFLRCDSTQPHHPPISSLRVLCSLRRVSIRLHDAPMSLYRPSDSLHRVSKPWQPALSLSHRASMRSHCASMAMRWASMTLHRTPRPLERASIPLQRVLRKNRKISKEITVIPGFSQDFNERKEVKTWQNIRQTESRRSSVVPRH